MRNRIFHILNIVTLIIIVPVSLLAWFGNAMSQVSYPGIDFAIMTTYVWWGAFYWIQLSRKETVWRVAWFLISLGVLSYWMAGGGASFWNLIFE
ncbi:hypothetical protein AOX59_02125 [Lentibacillus amyloliquefaciens]|uniref:Uncharacterized protein n=1 Tax=Lentibacillus amyloliquefaciens TaxID=1472767 RepID=A0A0U4FFQ8_9BACI|nr:hypothetical protein AOX59_02125 [Lentibacillus amyloliquefaciens]